VGGNGNDPAAAVAAGEPAEAFVRSCEPLGGRKCPSDKMQRSANSASKWHSSLVCVFSVAFYVS